MDPDAGGLDDRTFDGEFSGEGLDRLRDSLNEKLGEFMGDYSDDTLVEYIIVLLKNGKRKGEAVEELTVFLEDDSDAFVDWLWNHLFSNLHLYVQTQEPNSHDLSKIKPILERHSSIKISEESKPPSKTSEESKPPSNGFIDKVEFGSKLSNEERMRIRGRRWGTSTTVEEKAPPSSSVVDTVQLEKTRYNRRGYKRERSVSPQTFDQGKRKRHDLQQSAKRETPSSFSTVDAPRRLLQSAVRDAFTSLLPANPKPRKELTKLRRLRSVVLRPDGDSGSDVHSYTTRSVVGLNSNAFTAAIKAAAEAAEDVLKAKSGNVFDRLGHNDVVETRNISFEDHTNIPSLEDSNYKDYSDGMDYDEDIEGKSMMIDREADLASDYSSDDNGSAEEGLVRHHDNDVSRSIPTNRKEEPMKLKFGVAQSTDNISQKARTKDEGELNRSRRLGNIAANVNTWKPPAYQVQRDVSLGREVKNFEVPRTDVTPDMSVVKTTEEEGAKATATGDNEKRLPGVSSDTKKNGFSLPGSYSLVRPMEDAQARTIFVNNIHFAASKDSLSRHFNKFGEVLKVIILTDGVSGQPKGSAYIEFMRKESADLALALNGTSFMSRILKVVHASSVSFETGSVPSWPRMVRGQPFVASRMARTPMSRGISSSLRSRFPGKVGARSFQWKRDASAPSLSSAGTAKIGNTGTSSGRSLTYVRSEQTAAGNN